VKEKILQSKGYPVARQRLFYNNNELDNNKNLEFYDMLRRKTILTLRLWSEIDNNQSYIEVYGSVHCPTVMGSLLEQIRLAFN
jgi:Phosphatidylinositol 3- and 4-kinase/Ubiquitin family